MMKNIFFLLALLWITTKIQAQITTDYNRDYTWLLGYGDSVPKNGKMNLFFNKDTLLAINSVKADIGFERALSSICDTLGKQLFATNGYDIIDSNLKFMKNGKNITPFEGNEHGLSIPQGVLTLPIPNHDSLYTILHVKDTLMLEGPPVLQHYYQRVPFLYQTTINMNRNKGKGEVIEKHRIVRIDRFNYGQLTATRHANGRDWWILMHRCVKDAGSNIRLRFLLTPDSLAYIGEQEIGKKSPLALGQAVFSPNGCKYATFNTISPTDFNYLDIFTFDRKTGLLSDPVQITFKDSAKAGSIAISPNNRFLYVATPIHLYQYDLEAPNIDASKEHIADYDGFIDSFLVKNDVLASVFYLMQLAPDNKVYMSALNSVSYLHVINRPNEKGQACKFVQHGIKLPHFNTFAIPNFPNFRLGKQEGETCAEMVAASEISDRKEINLHLYPNPAQEVVTIHYDLSQQPREVSLYWVFCDLLGKEVAKTPVKGSEDAETINVSSLASGLYLCTLQTATGRVLVTKKLNILH